jgi:hypothetical protein
MQQIAISATESPPAGQAITVFTLFTWARGWSLFQGSWIQCTPSHHMHNITLLSPSVVCPRFATKIAYTFLASVIPLPFTPPLFDSPNFIWWRVQIVKPHNMKFSPSCWFLSLRLKEPNYPNDWFIRTRVQILPLKDNIILLLRISSLISLILNSVHLLDFLKS